MWKKRIESSVDYGTFLSGCDPRTREAYLEMTRILREKKDNREKVPSLGGRKVMLLCFCRPRCLDCHPLLPLLAEVVEKNPGTGLGILPHRPHEPFLRSLQTDRTIPTLPTVVFLEGDPPEARDILFGRPDAMDVVTWRTGDGRKALFRWIERASGGETDRVCPKS